MEGMPLSPLVPGGLRTQQMSIVAPPAGSPGAEAGRLRRCRSGDGKWRLDQSHRRGNDADRPRPPELIIAGHADCDDAARDASIVASETIGAQAGASAATGSARQPAEPADPDTLRAILDGRSCEAGGPVP